ncbi:serine protease [Synechococcus sp. J7-Johnson]|uniref:S1C family serine protease n=1 Tax=Synechococcus sp. J7-Johnson TaxID=2823737 RepID=UPI0020CD2717|nr:S1C family serine protease [Synechococcus sp. J7-Johnson]MCP9841708.1 serine protease [Synechococcus sp. J7-Johnson]
MQSTSRIKRAAWGLTAGAAGLALTLSGCGLLRATTEAPSARAAAATLPAPATGADAADADQARACATGRQSAEEVFRSAREGVAVVSTGSGMGSAFVVAQQNGLTYLATNAHVVDGSEVVRLKWADGSSDRARVVARGSGEEPTSDLALLAVEGTRGKVLRLRDQASAVGQEVFVIGAPKGLEFSLSRGVVSSLRGNEQILQIDAAVNPGNSGGPVLDAGQCVAGIATFKFGDSEGLNFAVSSKVVREFLAQLPAAGQPAAEPPDQRQARRPQQPQRPSRPDLNPRQDALCLFRAAGGSDEQIPCRISRVRGRSGGTLYDLAWADGSRNAYAFFADGRVAIRAEDGSGQTQEDEGSFRRLQGGVAVLSSGNSLAFIPGLDPVLN